MVAIVATRAMSFVRPRKRRLKDGTIQTYYYRVENVWEGGKVHQKVLEYLGTNPLARTLSLDPPLARRVAEALTTGNPTPTEIWNRLKDLDLDLPGRPRQVSLTYTPPLRRYSLRCE